MVDAEINDKSGNLHFILEKLKWIFKQNKEFALQCLIKTDKAEAMHGREIVELVKHLGGLVLCIRYLEYLTLEYQIQDPLYHTELAYCYIKAVKQRVSSMFPDGELDVDIIEHDITVFQLRQRLVFFLENSQLYSSDIILPQLQIEYMHKENALVLVKLKQFQECFELLIYEEGDFTYAKKVCKREYQITDDRTIFSKLYGVLIHACQSGLEDEIVLFLEEFHDYLDPMDILKMMSE